MLPFEKKKETEEQSQEVKKYFCEHSGMWGIA